MSDVGSIQGSAGGGLSVLDGVRARARRPAQEGGGGGGIAQRILNHIKQQGLSRETLTSTAKALTQHLFGPRATREQYQHVFDRMVNFLKNQGQDEPPADAGRRVLDTLA